MRGGSTVVRAAARRRWLAVLLSVAVLCSLPVAVRAWPTRAPGVDPAALRDRARASVAQPYQGFVKSSAAMALPELPRLGQVTQLLSGTTELRTWYAGPERWRVDVLGPGTERGLYHAPGVEHAWDYAANELIHIDGEQPVRLPRPADLNPPDLARRLLSATEGDRLSGVPARRVAGIAAPGLRMTPTDERTTVQFIDLWADPRTGLPLQVEVTARGVDRPILVTRFLEVSLTAPAADVLDPPAPRPGVGFVTTETPDVIAALNRLRFGPLPQQLAGQPRRDALSGVSAVAVYGAGLAQVAVVPLARRIGDEAYRSATTYGTKVEFPDGAGAVIGTSLLSILVLRSDVTGRTYLLAGMVVPSVLQQAGAELAGFRG